MTHWKKRSDHKIFLSCYVFLRKQKTNMYLSLTMTCPFISQRWNLSLNWKLVSYARNFKPIYEGHFWKDIQKLSENSLGDHSSITSSKRWVGDDVWWQGGWGWQSADVIKKYARKKTCKEKKVGFSLKKIVL
jgi:hypothetical protein